MMAENGIECEDEDEEFEDDTTPLFMKIMKEFNMQEMMAFM